ncbi:MAG: hypothetical protein WC178_01525 [Candidatus Paceibacterota bacterium]
MGKIKEEVSNKDGIGALEEIERILFGRTTSKRVAEGKIFFQGRKGKKLSLEEKRNLCAKRAEKKLSSKELREIEICYKTLKAYFEEKEGFFGIGRHGEKLSMRIKMILLIVRTKIRGEFFLPD